MAYEEKTASWLGSAGPSATSASLIQRLRARDAEAWRQLADLYGPLVYYWCRRYELKAEDAADVFQEVFSAIASGIHAFQHDRARGRFRGWLWTITRNKIHDHFRRLPLQEEALGGTDGLARMAAIPQELADDPTPGPDRNQLSELVHRAVNMVQAEFEPRTWTAFWRTAVDRQESARVAEELGMSAGAVRIAKSRVLHRIRVLLGDLNE
jgi:RNA polymerase sigma-70 factor (ECF subfamily)